MKFKLELKKRNFLAKLGENSVLKYLNINKIKVQTVEMFQYIQNFRVATSQGSQGSQGKVREIVVVWKSQGKVREFKV